MEVRTVIALAAALAVCSGGDLKQRLEQFAASAGGRTGVSAIHIESGEHIAVHGDEAFFMASVVKFPIALRVLELVDQGKLSLDGNIRMTGTDYRPGHSPIRDKYPRGTTLTVGELLEYMVSQSDNSACDVLLRLGGGPKAVTARVQEFGIEGIRIDRGEGELAADYQRDPKRFLADPRDKSTPDAMAALLARFQRGEALKPASTQMLRALLIKTDTGPQRLKGLLPPGTVVAHKTGTWGGRGGVNGATNDVGIVTLPGESGHIAIAVFNNGSKNDLGKRERGIAEIARALYDYWAGATKPH